MNKNNNQNIPPENPIISPLHESVEACSFPDSEEINKYNYDSSSEPPKYGVNSSGLEREVWEKLYEVQDPELPISVVDLGLIYEIEIQGNIVNIEWTVTYSGCPGISYLKEKMKEKILEVETVEKANLKIKYKPEWSIDYISERGKRYLREYGLTV